MTGPNEITVDDLNYSIASLIADTLDMVASHVAGPDPTGEEYVQYIAAARAMGYMGTLCAWRVAAGLAGIAGLKPDEVSALGTLIGAKPAD
jgi:hypothetical protein